VKEADNTPVRRDSSLEEIPVLLLVGGMGTRLRPVLSSKPKPLAPVGDIPFLELVVLQLRSQGIRRLVMCTGHQADQIKEEFSDGRRWDVSIEYSNEPKPLGTAGAIKFAERFLTQASDFLVMNGDSLLELDFRKFMQFHLEHGGWASIAVRRVPETARYGTVQVDELNRVVRFSEKMGIKEPGIVNGGVYAFKREILQQIPEGAASLEKDVLPGILEHGAFAFEEHGMFIDIGTPEDYARAQALYQTLSEAALSHSRTRSREQLGH
jgi:D-glycero-alpha-D-manno-heptose 1-phosphate guanylyltransferase